MNKVLAYRADSLQGEMDREGKLELIRGVQTQSQRLGKASFRKR